VAIFFLLVIRTDTPKDFGNDSGNVRKKGKVICLNSEYELTATYRGPPSWGVAQAFPPLFAEGFPFWFPPNWTMHLRFTIYWHVGGNCLLLFSQQLTPSTTSVFTPPTSNDAGQTKKS
jgi:hypothetical protein